MVGQLDMTQIVITFITTAGGSFAAFMAYKSDMAKKNEIATQEAIAKAVEKAVKEAVDDEIDQSEFNHFVMRPTVKLIHHSVFNRIDTHILYFKTGFDLNNPGKTALVREAMIRKYEIWKDVLHRFAEEVDECALNCEGVETCNKVHNLATKYFNEGISRYSTFYNDPIYTESERRGFKIFMGKFNKWHDSHVQATSDGIDRTCFNKLYCDCVIKGNIILDIYQSALGSTINGLEDTMCDVNGDLKGVEVLDRETGVRITI